MQTHEYIGRKNRCKTGSRGTSFGRHPGRDSRHGETAFRRSYRDYCGGGGASLAFRSAGDRSLCGLQAFWRRRALRNDIRFARQNRGPCHGQRLVERRGERGRGLPGFGPDQQTLRGFQFNGDQRTIARAD